MTSQVSFGEEAGASGPLALAPSGGRLGGGRVARLRAAWGRLVRLRSAVVGGLILLVVGVCALFAPWAPGDPFRQQIEVRLLPPAWLTGGSWRYPLGTDFVGRDYLSRLIYGSRVSVATGLLAVAVAGSLGVGLGLVAGYAGRAADTVISNAIDIMMALPFLLLALTGVALLGPSFRNMVIVLGITGWPVYARVVRAEVLHFREREFVLASLALGGGAARILFRHIVPNLASTIIVLASLEVARMIIAESFLSFLGLGIQPPTPSWGGMLGEGRNYMMDRWWLAAFPGLAIFVTTLGINLLGDGLRDLLDPHLKLAWERE